MFVHDRTKVRAVALVMACAASVQVWPGAHAQERPVTITKEGDVKAPQKTKKRKPGHASTVAQASAWRVAPLAERVSMAKAQAAPKAKVDPVKLVLETAFKQLGKPYRWAAVGPNAFDCSGFTMYAWQSAGVTLPHNSGAQRGATKPVSLADMKPGDLIFAPGHVGLYIGKGKMIHSPRTGRNVSVDPIHSNAYGAGRVIH